MPIQFDAQNKVFKLDTPTSSYALGIGQFDSLLHLYYGAPISDTDLSYLALTCRHASVCPSVEMDASPYFSRDVLRFEYSCNGCGKN